MSDFDPYHIWLEISPDEQPPTPQRLLGIAPDETDKETIREAALQRNAFIRQFSLGEQGKIAERLLNEIAAARDNILAGNVQTAVETPSPVETPIEPDVEKVDPAAVTPVSPILVADREPVTQEFPVSVVQPAKKPRRRRQQEIWKRPVVIGVSGVGVIGALALLMSMMSSGDVDPVVINSPPQPEHLNQPFALLEFSGNPKMASLAVGTPIHSNRDRVWAKVPLELVGLQATLWEAHQGRADVNIISPGWVVMATSTRWGGGGGGGDWEQELTTKQQLLNDGWVEITTIDEKTDDPNEPSSWSVFTKEYQGGEQLRLRTEKYQAPRFFFPANRVTKAKTTTNTIGMTFNKIPAGTFMMGSPETEEGRKDDEHQHKVTITKPFYMQTTEVTQGQWKEVMGTEPWKGKSLVKEGPNYPASYVSWDDAVAYCKKLSEAEGKTYRLPTEAEWEYACRAETTTEWSFGDDEKELGDYAWHRENAWDIDEKYAHHVGLKKSNAFGLYDMHGNVWEWCHDYYGKDFYQQSLGKDPTGPVSGSSRVLRGGSWVCITAISYSRSADRFWIVADRRLHDFGFRLVRELDDSTQSTPPPVPPTAPAIDSTTNTIGMELKLIPAGTFMMGSPEGETERNDDETQHKVTITKPFYMQTTEVTQGQWTAVMGTEPWKGKSLVKEGADYAVTYVSWGGAIAYCKKLGEKEGTTYRLPTEAEWEYACRAGTKTTWSFGNDEKVLGDYAWDRENAWDIDEKYAHQVELKKPNAFGLYDMHGNVWEWCRDYFGEGYYNQSPEKDPTGPASGSICVLRGGSWVNLSRVTRSARRLGSDAGRRGNLVGFRLVREMD
jgi:formylglycine-generating enzyme required for sulfatase activity